MLKLYTNEQFLTEPYRSKVFPLLFDLRFLKTNLLKDYYVLVDLVADCDVVVFPINYVLFYKFKEAFFELVDVAKKYNKPIWIYTSGDFGFTNYIKNSYTFRLGGFHSKLSENTFVMPSFINDPYGSFLPYNFSIIKREIKPTIGFVGHAQTGLKKYIKELLSYIKLSFKQRIKISFFDSQSFYPSSIKRAKYLHLLKKCKELDCDFIFRNKYKAGAVSKTEIQTTKREFYENIYKNAYTFCVRGAGNFSVRFYETLAIGRIPILLNTDCRLPMDNIIQWQKHCIILDESKNEDLEQQILNFHNSLSDTQFENIQASNRLLWETYLMRHNYFIKVHNLFIKKINKDD